MSLPVETSIETWHKLVCRMSTEGAILTMLENPDVFGVVNLGSIINILDRNARTVENVIPALEKAGVIRRDGKVLHLVASDPPQDRHDNAISAPQHDHRTTTGPPQDHHKSATKSGGMPIDANNANLANVDLQVKGRGLGLKAFDLAVDVEVQNQNQQQVQDQTQKPACASESATPATSSPQPASPEPRVIPARPPIPKPTPKLESSDPGPLGAAVGSRTKKPELEKPEREETEHEAIFAALAQTCYGGTGNLTKTVAGRIAGAAKQLRSAGYSAEDVGEINTWITTFEAWRGLVTPQTIVERAPAWGNDLKPASAPKQVNPNTQHRSHHLRADVQLERLQRERREREVAASGAEPAVASTPTVEVRRTQSAYPPRPLPGGPR